MRFRCGSDKMFGTAEAIFMWRGCHFVSEDALIAAMETEFGRAKFIGVGDLWIEYQRDHDWLVFGTTGRGRGSSDGYVIVEAQPQQHGCADD
jgi:hypothetical protein